MLEPLELRRAQERRLGAERRLSVGRVRSAVAAHVDREDVDERPVRDLAVHALEVVGLVADRRVLEERAPGARGEERHALLRVARVLEDLRGVPVVAHLVVVPERELRDLGVEAAHVLVEQVVEVVAAELVERLGDLRLGGSDEVAPHRAVVERQLGDERVVRVDRVARVDEEVRLEPPHRLVRAQTAARGVDPEALAHGVRAPGEAHASRGGGRRLDAAPGGDRLRLGGSGRARSGSDPARAG